MPDPSAPGKKIKVLISGHLPPPVGGMATYYQTLLSSNLGDQVEVHFVQTSSQKRQLANSGTATFSNLVSALQDGLRYTRSLLKIRPQVAHIGTAFGLSFLKHSYCVLISRLAGCRVLLHPHCSLQVLYTQKSKPWKAFFRAIVRRTHGLIVLSKEWLQLAEETPGLPIYYLPNCVDLRPYQQVCASRASQSAAPRPVSILYLGYLGQAKGSFVILEAAALLKSSSPQMLIQLVGSELTPGEVERLHQQVKAGQLADLVHLSPPRFDQDKLAAFQSADIFIYPSFHEGVPMAVLEAMSAGLPVIATRVGGLPDVVQNRLTGILIDPGQPQQLAAAILALVNQADLRLAMGAAGRRLAEERYSLESHVHQLVDIYQKVLDSGKRS